MSLEKPSPMCKVILLCERTLIDERSGKLSLIDVVVTDDSQAFPLRAKSMRCYIQLVAGVGQYQLTLEVLDLANDRIIAKGKGPLVNFSDRLTPMQLILPIPRIPISHDGDMM